jgi:hypothetical protein
MTIHLTSAKVGEYHQLTEAGDELMEVTFTYQAIEITWADPEFITSDDLNVIS